MKGFHKILLAAFVAMLLICACAVPAGLSQPTHDAELALATLRQSYRSAQLVVRGTCVQTHTDTSGAPCAAVEVDEVLAGNAKTGDLLHCMASGLKEGGSYLLFLEQGSDVHYSEDEIGFNVLASDAVETTGGMAKLKTAGVTLAEVRTEIARLDAVVSAPATSYYYTALADMVAAADEIFIGRVTSGTALKTTSFRSQEGGGTVEQELPAALLRIEAYGAVKGALKYGDMVELVYAPAMSADVVDAATLAAVTYGENAVPVLRKGQICIFFLIKGPDSKQNYYFPINPFQGYVRVDDDELRVSYVNTAIMNYAELTPLVLDIRAALGI